MTTTMERDAIETREVGAFKVHVLYDSDPMSPREWFNVGRFGGLSRWTFNDDTTDNPADAYRDARHGREPIIALPVKVVDGPYSAIETTDDWGYADGIYWAACSEVEAVGDHGVRDLRALKACLVAELDTMSKYLRGEVYGYVVVDGRGEVVESCWGYIGDDDYAMSMGVVEAEWLEGERWTRWAELPEWVRGQVLAWEEESVEEE